MPRGRPLRNINLYRLITVGQLNELLGLADFPNVGAAIRARARIIVREVFDMHTQLKYQGDKWPILRDKLVGIYPPLRNFPRRIEALQAYARRYANDQISRTRQRSRGSRLTKTETRDVDIRHELGTQALVHDQPEYDGSLVIRPNPSSIHLIRSPSCEEIPTQGRVNIPICRCYVP